jgi:hypothetical protein
MGMANAIHYGKYKFTVFLWTAVLMELSPNISASIISFLDGDHSNHHAA